MTSLAEPVVERPSWTLSVLMFETFACTMSTMAFVALIGPISRILSLQPWQLGVAVTTAGVAWMLCARWWGALSDRHGRRPIMLIGLSGFVVTYAALCAFLASAVHWAVPSSVAFVILLVGRTLAGFFYAAVPATSIALVADHFTSDRRTAAIAAVAAANAAGMVIGPAVAGLLALHGLVAPLLIMSIVPVASLVVVHFALPSQARSSKAAASPLPLRDARLRTPLIVAFLVMTCVSAAQIVVGLYAIDRLGLSPEEAARAAGIALGAVGIALVGASVVVRKLNWTTTRLIRIGAVVSCVGFAMAILSTQELALWGAHFVAAAGIGMIIPAFQALAANSMASHEQGASAGTVSSAQGLGLVCGPLLGSLLYALDARAPYVLIALLLLSLAVPPTSPGEDRHRRRHDKPELPIAFSRIRTAPPRAKPAP